MPQQSGRRIDLDHLCARDPRRVPGQWCRAVEAFSDLIEMPQGRVGRSRDPVGSHIQRLFAELLLDETVGLALEHAICRSARERAGGMPDKRGPHRDRPTKRSVHGQQSGLGTAHVLCDRSHDFVPARLVCGRGSFSYTEDLKCPSARCGRRVVAPGETDLLGIRRAVEADDPDVRRGARFPAVSQSACLSGQETSRLSARESGIQKRYPPPRKSQSFGLVPINPMTYDPSSLGVLESPPAHASISGRSVRNVPGAPTSPRSAPSGGGSAPFRHYNPRWFESFRRSPAPFGGREESPNSARQCAG